MLPKKRNVAFAHISLKYSKMVTQLIITVTTWATILADSWAKNEHCCRLQAVYSPITVKNFVTMYTGFKPCNRGNLLLRL